MLKLIAKPLLFVGYFMWIVLWFPLTLLGLAIAIAILVNYFDKGPQVLSTTPMLPIIEEGTFVEEQELIDYYSNYEVPDGTQNVDLAISVPDVETIDQPAPRTQPDGRWVWARVTAYCPCHLCCGKPNSHPQYGITSTGVDTGSDDPHDAYGYATAPDALPYGTRIYVPGYWESLQRNRTFIPTKPLLVDDTGGAMRRAWRDEKVIHIDVRYRTHHAAARWGRRWMRVFIYE